MGKTLLKHFTFVDNSYGLSTRQRDIQNECLADLVSELQHALNQAKKEVVSPRDKVIDDILNKAKLIQ